MNDSESWCRRQTGPYVHLYHAGCVWTRRKGTRTNWKHQAKAGHDVQSLAKSPLKILCKYNVRCVHIHMLFVYIYIEIWRRVRTTYINIEIWHMEIWHMSMTRSEVKTCRCAEWEDGGTRQAGRSAYARHISRSMGICCQAYWSSSTKAPATTSVTTPTSTSCAWRRIWAWYSASKPTRAGWSHSSA